MTPKTPEDMTDPTGIGERAPTQDAPIIPFEQAVMLRLDAIVAEQKNQGARLEKLCAAVASQGDGIPKKVSQFLSNGVLKIYQKQIRVLIKRVEDLEQASIERA